MSVIIQQKKEYRQKYRQLRDSIWADMRISESHSIAEKLFALEAYRSAETVFIYLSVGSEVITHEIMQQILRDKKRLVVPKSVIETHELQLYYINGAEDLVKGSFGILEPSADRTLKEAARDEIDLTLVPGLCFDRAGFRIGYGGGYYDRFLDGYKGTAVGLTFADCVCDALPREDCDRAVDIILTGREEICTIG